MNKQFKLGDIAVDVVFKDIKNIHLSVYPPTGRVRISAPARMTIDTVRVFAISKVSWIKKQQYRIRRQERETPREYLDRESHYVWGKRYLLKVVEAGNAPHIELKPGKMILKVRPNMNLAAKQAIVAQWYRNMIKTVVPDLIAEWEPVLGVNVKRFYVQRMKTKWGGCNPDARTIRLNTELAKKPKQCLEYILVHELVHMIEPTHNSRFIALMDKYLSQWRQYRDELNRLPVRHEDWMY